MTDKEIVQRAKDAEKRTSFGELVHSPVSRGVNSAYGIGFIEGMVEYRNSLQEEPVSIWHNASKKYPLTGKEIIVLKDDKIYYGKYVGFFHNGYVRAEIQLIDGTAQTYAIIDYLTEKDKWIYVEDLLNLFNVQRTIKNWEEPISEELEEAAKEYVIKEGYLAGLHYNSMVRSFKAGAEWHTSHNTKLPDNLLLAARKASIDMKDFDDNYLEEYPYNTIAEQKFIEGANWQKQQDLTPSTELGNFIDKLSKQFPEVSFAKLSRIAIRVAKWQQQQEYTCYEEAFEDGAKWKAEQFEEERLKHCDELTEAQAQIESDFVTQHLKENNRTPTFIDAIEYGMQLMKEQLMKDTIDAVVHIEAGGYPYIPQIELYDYDKDEPLAKEGDKYKVILIEED